MGCRCCAGAEKCIAARVTPPILKNEIPTFGGRRLLKWRPGAHSSTEMQFSKMKPWAPDYLYRGGAGRPPTHPTRLGPYGPKGAPRPAGPPAPSSQRSPFAQGFILENCISVELWAPGLHFSIRGPPKVGISFFKVGGVTLAVMHFSAPAQHPPPWGVGGGIWGGR
jgi:hypothetical protein